MTNEKKPKFSILSPSYNHQKYVRFFIESVLNQTEQDFELIIVDDNSTDNNVEEIKKFKDERIILIQHEYNQGINAGLNSAFARARGKYVIFMATDDMFAPNYLEVTSKYMDEHPECDVYYSSLRQIDENNEPIKERPNAYSLKQWSKFEFLKRAFTKGNYLTSPGMTMRYEAFKRLCPLDLSIIQYQDYAMHIKLLIKGEIYVSTEKLIDYRIISSQTNVSAKSSLVLNREKMEVEKLLNSFLLIDNVDLLKNIFDKDLEEFGEVTEKTIPYFLGRLALKSPQYQKKEWGYKTVMNFISKKENFELLHDLYGFDFKQYMGLASNFEGVSNDLIADFDRKISRYKKLFNVFLIVSIVLGVISLLLIAGYFIIR